MEYALSMISITWWLLLIYTPTIVLAALTSYVAYTKRQSPLVWLVAALVFPIVPFVLVLSAEKGPRSAAIRSGWLSRKVWGMLATGQTKALLEIKRRYETGWLNEQLKINSDLRQAAQAFQDEYGELGRILLAANFTEYRHRKFSFTRIHTLDLEEILIVTKREITAITSSQEQRARDSSLSAFERPPYIRRAFANRGGVVAILSDGGCIAKWGGHYIRFLSVPTYRDFARDWETWEKLEDSADLSYAVKDVIACDPLRLRANSLTDLLSTQPRANIGAFSAA